MSASLDPLIARWKQYLRYDPTRWLLETDDPSIQLWYQLDIAHRPEDAAAVLETRERVLYSDAVQVIFRAQNEAGYWASPDALAEPEFTATLWNLALLAELGIPRSSRRARDACAFVLQNFLNEDGHFKGLNAAESGYLLRALAYFRPDTEVVRAALALEKQVRTAEDALCALWGWRALTDTAEVAAEADLMLERVLNVLGVRNLEHLALETQYSPLTFPQFDPEDPLFLLRVLAEYDRLQDPRAVPLMDALVAKQDERARWTLERDFNAQLLTPFERAGEPSRWITLNALRVIVKLVGSL